MNSKTFKCVEHEEEVLEVYPFTGDEAGRKFSLLMPHVSSNAGIAFDSTTAPALALAILEVAGVEPVQRDYESYDDGTPEHLQAVTYFLKQYNEAQERATTEAEAQAKLEAEALELFNVGAMTGSHSQAPHESFGHIPDYAQPKWLAVARRAREMRAEK